MTATMAPYSLPPPILFDDLVHLDNYYSQPNPSSALLPSVLQPTELLSAVDQKDPQCFLRRCSGCNKKTKARCSSNISKKMQSTINLKYLPTCNAHRDQLAFAGYCKHKDPNGDPCLILFKWNPPHLELCPHHQNSPDSPCYLFKLPLELRHLIYRYLLPTEPIGSSSSPVHESNANIFQNTSVPPPYAQPFPDGPPHIPSGPQSIPLFPLPLQSLLLVNRQFYTEVKDLMFSIVPFIISIRKDGTFMCGIRLLEPTRGDGSSHFLQDGASDAKARFLKNFDFVGVKNYHVDILLENSASPVSNVPHPPLWDEEVEIYDIRGQ